MVVQDKPNYRDVSQGQSGSTERKQRLRERFEVVKKLGQGTYGKVQLAINKETKQEVAIKTIKKAKIENEQDLVRIRREIQIMSSIHHPHIIHIYEVFENQEKIVLIMQYASGGELYDYLGCRKKLEETEARRVFRQVASAIFYCHKNRICHRDLKLENILLDDRGNAKIADFGLSNVFDEKFKLKTFCGSPLYASPEIVKGTPYCGPEVDCWSLGVLLYTLVYGAMPFDGSNFKRLVKQISEGEYFEPKEKSGASGLIRRLLTVDINQRATIRDICSDWWVNHGYDHSLLKIAGDMANLTPVRLDLLLALSSPSSQATDQSAKKQPTIITQPEESKNVLCNGYYSKSHPLRVAEDGGTRRRTVTKAVECDVRSDYATKDIGRLQNFSTVGGSKGCANEQAKGNKTYSPLADSKKTDTNKTPAICKNESNTLIIVQDLIKDVISKVEQNINSSKMELLKNTAPKQAQEKPQGDRSSSTVANQRRESKDGGMECESVMEDQKAETLRPPVQRANKNSFLQQSRVTTASETEKISKDYLHSDKSTVVEVTKMADISSDANEAEMRVFPKNTVFEQKDIFSDIGKNIPNKTWDLQSRKTTVKRMEPDVVIPIFNVCCNIPERSSDLIRSSAKDPKMKEAFQPISSRISEQCAKVVDCGMKPDDKQLPNNESIGISNSSSSRNTDIVPNNHSKDFVSSETDSESTYGRKDTDLKGNTSPTEAPKLPPRKRFLIKIPKQEQSKETDVIPVRSGESARVPTEGKQEGKISQEELGTQREDEKGELQTVGKDIVPAPFVGKKEQKELAGSEDDASVAPNNTTSEEETTPKLCQRKSRRDSSKRSLIFNAKKEINREQIQVVPENQNCREDKREHHETVENVTAKELNDCNAPSSLNENEKNEALKDIIQLPQDETNRNNNILKDSIPSNVNEEKEFLNSEQFSEMCTSRMRNEVLEREAKSIGLITRNGDFEESERDKSLRPETRDAQNVESNSGTVAEPKRSKSLAKSKQRSLSRTRAMSMEFESLALMTLKVMSPPRKPPGKVEIPKTFDPTQPVTSPKAEMREIIFIPTACVSDNKEKIQKKIEKVKKSAIVMPPRRMSEAGVVHRKKKYTRSKTDFIIRNDDSVFSSEDQSLAMDEIQGDTTYQEDIEQNEGTSSPENMEDETVPNEMWYSAVFPDSELEECGQETKIGDRAQCTRNFNGVYNENDVSIAQHNHRHSVDTESGYWTPPEMANGENSANQPSMRIRDERVAKKHDNSEKILLQRAAFKNSKLRMKLSDEGLDMCSLSSSLESGIYSWRQEDANGRRISPDSEFALKALSSSKCADGSYAPIARSFKKMTFPPEHSSTSELSENCSILSETEKYMCIDAAAFEKYSRTPRGIRPNGMDSKPIKPSDSQSSYGSNDISDDVFESWAEKEDVLTSKENCGVTEDAAGSSAQNVNKTSGRNKKSRNWQHGEAWNSYSTDKESSDNDDDLDLMVDEAHQVVYGTEGLWQFLKSVNQHLSDQLKTAAQKITSKALCHRSKSQESKHPDDAISQKRPATRSLSREEKQRKGTAELRHFVSEGKLANADSTDCFENSYKRFNDTRYSSGYMASGSSLEDSGMAPKDFMSSANSFYNHSDDTSVYGTLRRDKYFHSSSALSSPALRKKSLQNPHSSGDLSNMYDNEESVVDDLLEKYSATSEQKRKLSLYGTLRPKHLSQQGRAQSQILLSTDDGYQLLYNEKLKKDSSSETRHGSLGTLGSFGNKASSEVNISTRESQLKDYEKLLLADRDEDLKRSLTSSAASRNISTADSSYHTAGERSTSRAKKIVSDKGARRVSFSSDVKASKSDYHSSIRLNSLNKVREANEESLSSSKCKNNVYEDEQDSGSLLEALKTYGYRGIMSQKLQSNPERYEPRISYRLPTECFLTPGLNNPGWDDFEYLPMDTTLAYQQPLYPPIEPMEYYHCKSYTKGAQMKKNIREYTELPFDDDAIFKDIFRGHQLGEGDTVSRRKPAYKFQDLSDSHSDRYAVENWDAKPTNSRRKKSLESTTAVLGRERKNSDSGKITQNERERDSEDVTSTDASESRVSKQNENTIEILSEKIQALKSRCQRKSLDESRLKKELEESGILSNETQNSEKTIGPDAQTERVSCYADSAETLSNPENESAESVSDRIWRKSFYPRFNDVSTGRRKKSSLLETELLSSHSFLRSPGKFNVDEEGGVEEPWMRASLKRRNSNFSRSLPRHTMIRSSSQDSETKLDQADFSSRYKKRGATEAERKNSSVIEVRSLNQFTAEEQNMSTICNKTMNFTNDETETKTTKTLGSGGSNSSDRIVSRQGTENDSTELTAKSVQNQNNSVDVCSVLSSCERTKDSEIRPDSPTNLSKGDDNIPEVQSDLTNGCPTGIIGTGDIFVPEAKNEILSPVDLTSSPSAHLKTSSEENLENQEEQNSTESNSVEITGTPEQCNRLETVKA